MLPSGLPFPSPKTRLPHCWGNAGAGGVHLFRGMQYKAVHLFRGMHHKAVEQNSDAAPVHNARQKCGKIWVTFSLSHLLPRPHEHVSADGHIAGGAGGGSAHVGGPAGQQAHHDGGAGDLVVQAGQVPLSPPGQGGLHHVADVEEAQQQRPLRRFRARFEA